MDGSSPSQAASQSCEPHLLPTQQFRARQIQSRWSATLVTVIWAVPTKLSNHHNAREFAHGKAP